MHWCTDECYKTTCTDKKTTIFLIFVALVIVGLLSFSIYLVTKPIKCEVDEIPEAANRMFKRFYKKVPRCRETSILLYPQVVAIVENDTEVHVCTGVIISKKWVLSVAHCLVLCADHSCNNLVIRAGSSHSNRGGEEYAIIHVEIHPQFNSITLKYDIGLLKVKNFNLNVRSIEIAKISSVPVRPHMHANILGWAPYNKVDVIYRDNSLKRINLTIESHIICQYRLKGGYNKFTLTHRMLCGTYPTRGGGCYTDAGGPLIIKGVVGGLAMFGQICYSCDYHMSVLIDVYYFRDFIKKFTKLKEINIDRIKIVH
ncbi:hypothetical protein ILUMI_26564 [Ignelater luminosus]|uniref:trypsin n=1 Tax=Ignelater luminosus TaxID=2038154 RepID=A0A8K0FYT9_IGNLU|nr:hypothetical protein ILUMI_26564 [Ignelater luminosus]